MGDVREEMWRIWLVLHCIDDIAVYNLLKEFWLQFYNKTHICFALIKMHKTEELKFL